VDFQFIICLRLADYYLAFMVEEKRMAQVWVSWETYRRLLSVCGGLQGTVSKNGHM
jgi:hypothetical protein